MMYMRLRTVSIQMLIAVLAIAWPATPCRAAGDKPELIVEMDRNRIYEGESVLYGVTLKNAEKPQKPELNGFDDFLVAFLGSRSFAGGVSIQINNNVQRTEVIKGSVQYVYRLTPKKTGNLTIPAPTAEVDGEKLSGKELSLVVTAPQDQDVVRMEITTEPSSVYPLQPFTVILSISVKDLPEPYADENPVGVQTNPPLLQIPWVEDEHLPEGLKPNVGWQRWLESLRSSAAGDSQLTIMDKTT